MDTKADVKEFTRKLILNEKFHDTAFHDESLVRKKSKMNPKTENHELEKILDFIEFTDPMKINSIDNLTVEERNALKSLKNYDDIIIKKADKGNVL